MINQTYINDCLSSLFGYEQGNDPNTPTLNEAVLKTASQRNINALHPLLSMSNLINLVNKFDDFNQFLYKKRQNAIEKLTSSIMQQKNMYDNAKELVSNLKMYDGVGNWNEKILKDNRFVGYKLQLKQPDLSININQIGLQIDTTNPTFKLYFYHSSKFEAIATREIVHNKTNSFAYYEIESVVLPYITDGYYIVGYYESDLNGQAINKRQNFPPCLSCNQTNAELYSNWSKYVEVNTISIASENLNEDLTKWQDTYEVITTNTNYGLNLSFSVYCDLSTFFCNNKYLFTDILGKAIVIELLKDLAFSDRFNQTERRVSQMATYALGNKENNQVGLESEFSQAIKAFNVNLSGLNKLCLPCENNKFKLTYGSIYGG